MLAESGGCRLHQPNPARTVDRALRLQRLMRGCHGHPEEMRRFAVECLGWSDKADNASHRDLMVQIAGTWMNTAAIIERRVAAGEEMVAPDIRHKLD
jgi:hypothetical protein